MILDDYIMRLDNNEEIDDEDLKIVQDRLVNIKAKEENFDLKIALCRIKLQEIIDKVEILKEKIAKEYKEHNARMNKVAQYLR